jgi:NADP-dependent 3-hydroxy acid dehydrogenase YdfG
MSSPPSQQQAIITGASSGIGEATALAFAKAGINLALMSRSAAKLEKLAAKAREMGVEAIAYPFDLEQLDAVKGKFEAIAKELGRVDILVNNAGMGYTNPIQETSLADWQKVINLNLTSIFQSIQGILPQMIAQKEGTIVNVTSIAAINPFPGWGAYSVSKAALLSLSKTLAAEQRANGIRVVNLCPGAVNTPIWDTETVNMNFNRAAMLTPEIIAQSILHVVSLPHQATVEDLIIMPSAGAL